MPHKRNPDPVRAADAAWPGCCGAIWGPGSRTWPCGTSATSPTARWSASSSPTPACSPTTCCAGPPGWCRTWWSTPSACGPTWSRAPSGSCSASPCSWPWWQSGMTRDAAYRVVQRDARPAWEETRPFRAVLEADPEVTLDAAALDAGLRPGPVRCATCRRFARGTTRRWRREPDSWCTAARSASSTTPATTGCSWWRRTASRPST